MGFRGSIQLRCFPPKSHPNFLSHPIFLKPGISGAPQNPFRGRKQTSLAAALQFAVRAEAERFLVTLATMVGSSRALLSTSDSCACFLKRETEASAHRRIDMTRKRRELVRSDATRCIPCNQAALRTGRTVPRASSPTPRSCPTPPRVPRRVTLTTRYQQWSTQNSMLQELWRTSAAMFMAKGSSQLLSFTNPRIGFEHVAQKTRARRTQLLTAPAFLWISCTAFLKRLYRSWLDVSCASPVDPEATRNRVNGTEATAAF